MNHLFIKGDAKRIPLADDSVQCVVTSPPYWGLRNYGVKGQIGLEPTPDEYVTTMVAVFREVRRVLRGDGTLWLNLGDTYIGGGRGGNPDDSAFRKQATNFGSLVPRTVVPKGLKPKDLAGIPWRVALALQSDGWWLRSDIIWAKPNAMCESVTDRPTKSHEYVFLMTKNRQYTYDDLAIAEPTTDKEYRTNGKVRPNLEGHFVADPIRGRTKANLGKQEGGREFRNKRSVWSVVTASFPGAHFATFPPDLIEPCIKAGTSERGCCPHCRSPWTRIIESKGGRDWRSDRMVDAGIPGELAGDGSYKRGRSKEALNNTKKRHVVCWQQSCDCPAHDPVPCVVFDPFGGAMTTAVVAEALGRRAICLELNSEYLAMGKRRVERPHADLGVSETSFESLPLFAPK